MKFYALTWKKSTMKTTLRVDRVVFHWKCGKRQHQSGSEKETRSKSKCKYLHKDKVQILAQPAWIPCILDICRFQPAESRERFPTLFRNPDDTYLEIKDSFGFLSFTCIVLSPQNKISPYSGRVQKFSAPWRQNESVPHKNHGSNHTLSKKQ